MIISSPNERRVDNCFRGHDIKSSSNSDPGFATLGFVLDGMSN